MTTSPIRAYKVASSDSLVNLEKAVNQFIASGWQPYGPPFMTQDSRLVQALVLPAGTAAPATMQAGNGSINAAPQPAQAGARPQRQAAAAPGQAPPPQQAQPAQPQQAAAAQQQRPAQPQQQAAAPQPQPQQRPAQPGVAPGSVGLGG